MAGERQTDFTIKNKFMRDTASQSWSFTTHQIHKLKQLIFVGKPQAVTTNQTEKANVKTPKTISIAISDKTRKPGISSEP